VRYGEDRGLARSGALVGTRDQFFGAGGDLRGEPLGFVDLGIEAVTDPFS
jgi:hypothetical protein